MPKIPQNYRLNFNVAILVPFGTLLAPKIHHLQRQIHLIISKKKIEVSGIPLWLSASSERIGKAIKYDDYISFDDPIKGGRLAE